MKKTGIFILLFFISLAVSSQTISVEEYINIYKDIAILEMKRTGVPASVTLAQGLLETQNGNSDLVKRSNNHFGIKCKSNWTGASVFHDDDERGECFRKYGNAEDSYRDHSDFLRNGSRYAFLFGLDPADYKGWAYGLKKAGYATNPRYPDILIKNIEANNLHQYDLPETGETAGVKKMAILNEAGEINHAEMAVNDQMNTAKNLESIKAGKTLFNRLKAVYVLKGTSMLAIATEFDITLIKLMEYNDLKSDGLLKEDQWIFLEKKLKQGNRDFYIASHNETLYNIAQTNAVQLASLVQFNNIGEHDIIKKGTKIRLRPIEAHTDSKRKSSENKFHQVQLKEGLYAISNKYKVTVQELKEWNNLTVDALKAGQQLIISK